MSFGVGHRCGSDLALLWVWCRLAATARIRPLAWEPPYATGAALKRKKKKERKKKKQKKTRQVCGVHINKQSERQLSTLPERSAVYPAIIPLLGCKHTFANASMIVQKQFRPIHAAPVTEC